MVILVDLSFRILEFNELASEHIQMLSGKRLIAGDDFIEYFGNEEKALVIQELKTASEGETTVTSRNFVSNADGKSLDLKYCIAPLKDENSKIIAISFSYLDITSENEALKNAEQSSFLLDLVFQRSHEGFLVVNLTDFSFRANPEFFRIFGLDNESLIEEIKKLSSPGKWESSFPFSVKQSLNLPLKQDVQVQIFKSGTYETYAKIFRNELTHPNGSQILLLSAKDVSDIVLGEKSRIENELRFKTIAKNFPNGNITLIDKNLTIAFTDGIEYETDLGSFQPRIGQLITDQYGSNYSEYIIESVNQAFEGISEQFDLNFGLKTFSILITPLPDPDGKINLVMKIARNISEEKNALLEAHYRREYLRQIIDEDPNIIYVKNKEGNVILANKSVANFFGTNVKEFIENSTEYFKTYKWRYEEVQDLDDQIFKTLKPLTSEEAIFQKDTKKMHLFQITRTPFVAQGNELSILCVGVDITDRVNAENELVTQREYLRHILDTDPNLIFVKDAKGKFLLVNKAFAEFYQTTPEAIIGKTDEQLKWKESDLMHFQDSDNAVIQSNEPITAEESNLNPISGKLAHFVTTKKPLLDADGNLNILGVVTDITIQKNQEEKVRKSEELLQEIFNRVADSLFIVDANSLNIMDCNEKAVEMIKVKTKENLIGKSLLKIKINKDGSQVYWKNLFQKLKEGNQADELEISDFQGENFWGSMAATLFSQEGKYLVLLRIADISAQKKSEEQIMQALHEKEILIQEIHHRVKNNMAVISSLLQLQTGYIKDPALVNVFKDSQSRIKSMALIHEKLYQSKTLAKVEMESYVRELTRTLLYTYSAQKANIQINTYVDNVYLDINSAVPCGLIINEIISNACKHAFVGRDTGKIDIYFSKHENQFQLEVKDNGVGMPEDTDFSNFKSLGMNLVQALSSQLGARLEIKTTNGVSFSISFVEKVKPNRE
jgi:PAS domain S-box-containing protein